MHSSFHTHSCRKYGTFFRKEKEEDQLKKMMSLKMVEETLPAGFRFHPRDDELICDYLVKMVAGCAQALHLIVVDLNKSEPWDIPQNACVGGKEYYFYSQRDRKYSTGLRTNRATVSGYWKATGKDRTILRKGTLVGMRKTLVFYEGRAPKGKKTDWVMHEFRLEGPLGPPKLSSSKEDWVLCRVFFKSNNDVVTKQELDYSGGEQASPSSPSLPPLMDTTYFDFSFDPNPSTDQHEQVPCFSIFATDQNPNHSHNYQPLSYLMNHQYSMELANFPTKSYGGLPAEFGSNYLTTATSSSSSEQQVLKTVLNQLTKMESGGSPSLGEASTTSESLLSEVDLSSMWNSQ